MIQRSTDQEEDGFKNEQKEGDVEEEGEVAENSEKL